MELVRPLEDDWREILDAVASGHDWPTSSDVDRLGTAVEALSREYNRREPLERPARNAEKFRLAARLGFSFARDVPKGAAAVRELVALNDATQGPLRVLDLGAGIGATSWGVARALRARGRELPVEAVWMDGDAAALDVGSELVRERQARTGPHRELELRRTLAGDVASWRSAARGERFELVLLGQVLSEIDVGEPAPHRVEAHAALLGDLLEEAIQPGGSVVVVEPALRDRTRHLHAVRDRVASLGATIYAPCLHAAPCPALEAESDWCHEDLDVDLPPWLVPVARAAGLRHEGLSFSYLVLRKDGVTLAAQAGAPLRVVSRPLPSKGKCELYLCGRFAGCSGAERGPGGVATRARVMRLAREEKRLGGPRLEELARGDLVAVEPAPAPPDRSGGVLRLPAEVRVETRRA